MIDRVFFLFQSFDVESYSLKNYDSLSTEKKGVKKSVKQRSRNWLEKFFVVSLWVVFGLLASYTFLSWKKENWVKNTDVIRKTWYLLYVLGCLIYLTKHPHSLFDDWKNYVIVLVAFIVIDSMVFLNLYFVKLGGHELKKTEKQVDRTQQFLDLTNNKVQNMEKVLNTYAYPSYTTSREAYIQELEEFFKTYADLESLHVDLLPYKSELEKNEVLADTPKAKAKVARLLGLRRTYYSSKDNLMLLPLVVQGDDYVAKVTTTSETVDIIDTDANIFNILLMVYLLAVKGNNDDEDGDD